MGNILFEVGAPDCRAVVRLRQYSGVVQGCRKQSQSDQSDYFFVNLLVKVVINIVHMRSDGLSVLD